jgi:hypothetical protein
VIINQKCFICTDKLIKFFKVIIKKVCSIDAKSDLGDFYLDTDLLFSKKILSNYSVCMNGPTT